jgi:ERCC4-type nuclease
MGTSLNAEQMNAKEDTIRIVVDDRERWGGVFPVLEAMADVDVKVRRLPVGDYQVDGRILFERKTLGDFAISILDGRLFKQMTRLATVSLKGVLVLEGGSSDLQQTGMRREALQGALITISLILGIPVLRAMDPEETARLMVYAARQSAIAATGGLHRPGYRPKGKRKRQLFILQGLPGVGPKRAAQLLDRFGSVQGVIDASLEELASTNGIGVDTAQNIKSAVCEPIAAYDTGAHWMPDV